MQFIRIATNMKLLQRTRNPIDNLSRKPDIELTKTRSTSSPTAFQIAASAILPPPPALAAPSPSPGNFPNEINRLVPAMRPRRRAAVIELSQIAPARRKASDAKGLRRNPPRPPARCHRTVKKLSQTAAAPRRAERPDAGEDPQKK
ncbi:MAG: hypothetical protein KF899_06435 [Parvibaculum sp.]|nr:hypothetical protein [Parvibaculum sp.]